MMTLKEAEDKLYNAFVKIENKTFSEDNLIFSIGGVLGLYLATLKQSAYISSIHLKAEAMRQYCHDIQSIRGNVFLVSDKMFKLIRKFNMTTSFGSNIKPLDQLYGIYHTDDYVFEGSPPVCIVFNRSEIKKASELYDVMQYISPHPEASLEYGQKYRIEGTVFSSNEFIGWDDDFFSLLQHNSDPDIYWDINDYM